MQRESPARRDKILVNWVTGDAWTSPERLEWIWLCKYHCQKHISTRAAGNWNGEYAAPFAIEKCRTLKCPTTLRYDVVI